VLTTNLKKLLKKRAKSDKIEGRERSHLNCGLSFFIFGGRHEEKQENKAAPRVDLHEMQDLLGKLLRNLRDMQVSGYTHERGCGENMR
jgi:hypothetical protein